ncbi:hypothetical protein [Prauserella shujinwangii]|uniref:hypothetical protein n=1 Tax=Prauserella shujinwangii TaxID=1453103 RepID=UPI000D06796A|nr:hypothetical protein [Prauserella shujinwangii]
MEYQLTAELTTPPDAPDLDPLQQVGVVSLLDTRLSGLVSIEGPDGMEITPIEHTLNAHLGGVIVNWLLDAPALVFAEDATRTVLEQLLEETELLVGWEVKHCAVTATDDQLASALAVGEEHDEVEVFDFSGPSEEERALRRTRLLDASRHLRAFGPEAFGAGDGDISEEDARYVAGALMHGIEMLTDELFGDIQTLEDEDTTADQVDALWVLDELPQRFADTYTALFAKQFLVATAILGHRLTLTEWTPPLCTAEALALHIAKSRAEIELDLADVLGDDKLAQIFAVFDGYAFENHDHELLYEYGDISDDSPASMDSAEWTESAEGWFRPHSHLVDAETLHPYLTDENGDGGAPSAPSGP